MVSFETAADLARQNVIFICMKFIQDIGVMAPSVI